MLRDLFEGDPEINALAEKAIATMKELGATLIDIRLDAAFIEAHLKRLAIHTRKSQESPYRSSTETRAIPQSRA